MSSADPLEEQCRRLVRLLPAEHRAAHGEDLVATLLDTVDERGVLPLRERLSVLALAVRLRVVTPVTGPATAALLVMLVLTEAALAMAGLLSSTVNAALFAAGAWTPVADLPLSFDLGSELAGMLAQDLVFGAGWLLALYGLLRGRRFAAPLAAVLAGAPLIAQAVTNPDSLLWSWTLLKACVLVAALLAWRNPPRTIPGRPRRWALGLAAAIVLLLTPSLLLSLVLPVEFEKPVIWGLAAVVAVLAALTGRGRPWLLLAGSWLAALLALVHLLGGAAYSGGVPAQAPAGLTVAVLLAGLALDAHRRLTPAGAAPRVARR